MHRVIWAHDRSRYVAHEVRPVFRKCGPRFGARVKELQGVLAESDADSLVAQLEGGGTVTIALGGEPVELSADELEVRLVERQGTATHGDRQLLVALDTELDEDLVAEGWAREIVHRIQTGGDSQSGSELPSSAAKWPETPIRCVALKSRPSTQSSWK